MRIGSGIHLGREAHFCHTAQIGGIDVEFAGDAHEERAPDTAAIVLDQVQIARRYLSRLCKLCLLEPDLQPPIPDTRAGQNVHSHQLFPCKRGIFREDVKRTLLFLRAQSPEIYKKASSLQGFIA
jgi:hypothetical protein